jgi:D-3-phosphoglycerate dehydrogenase
MLIVVADDLPKTALELLRAEGWDVDSKSGRSPEELSKDVAEADAIVVRSATKVTPEIIAAARSCGRSREPDRRRQRQRRRGQALAASW